jgi:amino acid adenylation domain-containing protein
LVDQLLNVYTPPRTALETTLAEIFTEVLNTGPIGIHDNFFSAGGDSLSGAQVAARIRDRLHRAVPDTALFRFPTIAELSGVISENATPHPAEIGRKGNGTVAPLSLAQQRMWLFEQLEPQYSINNVTRALRLHGELNSTALGNAIAALIQRHEILRTTFEIEDVDAEQHIHATAPSAFTSVNLTDFSASRQKEEVTRLATEEAQHSFDLTRLPLMRALLIRVGHREHVLMITLHHIISDGWSMGIFSRELEVLYDSALGGEAAQLPELPIQYADFAEWQRRWLQGPEITPLADYWTHALTGAPRLMLPFDRPYSKTNDYRAERRSLQLPPELTRDIKRLAHEENCSLFMTVLAGFNALLHRYTGENDIVIGAPVSGRHDNTHIQESIGFFVNTIALRTDLSHNPTFRQLLGRVRKTALAAYQHSALPFDKVVELLRPDRHDLRNPLFDVMINLHEAAWHEFKLAGLEVEEWHPAEPLTDVALSLDLSLQGKHLELNFNFQTALFDEWRIDNMLANLYTLLEGCATDPDCKLSDLPLLSEQERHTLLVAWNDTQADFPADTTIPELFERQVHATPDGTALIFENRKFTYAELNAHANRLAHLLLAAGIAADQTVALLMNRSHEVMVCILAVLKAGGAYMPLDPKHPPQRLKTIIEDAAPKVLLTSAMHRATAKDIFAGKIIQTTDLPFDARTSDSTNPNVSRRPEQLAYVLYTSGSTGAPKGVMVQHDAVISLAFALQSRVFDHSQRHPFKVSLSTALTFDASVQQWIRLLWGDCLVILPEGMNVDPKLFVAALRTQAVDVLDCTPTQLRLLFAEGLFEGHGEYPEIVLCGGEAVDQALWDKASSIPRVRFYNVYGPTECTVDATCCRIDPRLPTPSIGRPHANVRAYILDVNRNPLPIGVKGELWLGGIGVARGYLNRAELTRERFVKDPFGDDPHARLYKTGDLARYLPDGNIEYLGRADYQVKMRGFRIEPGEIETVLRRQAMVKDCVVIMREDAPGDQRLSAYVIPAGDGIEVPSLMRVLKTNLPDYMVPADIIPIDAFPLTSSGKIDRKALPAPVRDRWQATEFIAPRTPYEIRVAAIWAQTLSVPRPGIHDNFFDLGGHSLLAIRVMARINRDFGIQLPLRELFQNPNIEGLVQAIIKNKSQSIAETALMDVLTELENISDAHAERLLKGKLE